MKSDIEIAAECELKDIREIAKGLGISEDGLELYGKYKAKLTEETLGQLKGKQTGKLILVTAINPTPAGEGKTTMSVGLAQAFGTLGKRAVLALREPSLGPCFGLKGGAAGGGYSQVVPMEDINLHFTGDFHAVTAANNLLAALLDNHIHQGNALNIDTRAIVWKRCMDMNDRALRNIVVGLGDKNDGVVREDHFVITVASEIMAILCLSEDMKDLKERLSRIIVAYNHEGEAVTAGQLNAVGSMAALLKDALRPNLVQTLEHTPVLIHGGPFANIAHGCNSVTATRAALALGDYCITEAGFGADLGAEKFLDIKCPVLGRTPDAVVLVATIRALKYNGGVNKDRLKEENIEALKAGSVNLKRHIENLSSYGVKPIVTINRFDSDTEAEIAELKEICNGLGVSFAVSEVYTKGGAGAEELAGLVIAECEKKHDFHLLYTKEDSLKDKIITVATKLYGAADVEFSSKAEKEIRHLTELGLGDLPVCIAKTQYSFSDDATALGAPEGFTFHIRDVYVSAGAGFVVALSGSILSMPGLPGTPAAFAIDVDDSGRISGLF